MESLEHINALTLVFAALCIFAIAYRVYGIFLANKVLRLDAGRITPAVRFADVASSPRPIDPWARPPRLPA